VRGVLGRDDRLERAPGAREHLPAASAARARPARRGARSDTRRAPSSTRGVYAAALRFLYDITLDRPAVAARIPRRRVPERLPTILSTAEVERLLAAAHSPKHRAILMTAYRPARRPARHRHLPHPRARRASRRVRHLRPHPLPYGAPVYAPP